MPSNARLSTYRTIISADGAGTTHITYVSTRVVSFDADTVTLDSGGWQTVTTKRKMVQAANQFGLGYTVAQVKGEWFVIRLGRSPEGYPSTDKAHGAITLPFRDGMTFPRGTVVPARIAA